MYGHGTVRYGAELRSGSLQSAAGALRAALLRWLWEDAPLKSARPVRTLAACALFGVETLLPVLPPSDEHYQVVLTEPNVRELAAFLRGGPREGKGPQEQGLAGLSREADGSTVLGLGLLLQKLKSFRPAKGKVFFMY